MFFNILLFLCGFGALLGPLLSERIANRLVEFIFVMGFCAATFGRVWSEAVVIEALLRPIQVCMAVLFGAFIFSFTHDSFRKCIRKILKRAGPRVAVGGAVIFVGLLAALLTSAVAVLVLCELLIAMRLQRDCEVHVAVLGCFAIGLGGGLCLIGGPVATIAIAKLSSPPYYADNWFLFHLLGGWIFPAVLTLGVLSGVLFAKLNPDRELPQVEDPYSLWKILLLAGRMYVFIAGLVLLGSGIVPLIDRTILDAPHEPHNHAASASRSITHTRLKLLPPK